MKFRKRPVVIEAESVAGLLSTLASRGISAWPNYLREAVDSGVVLIGEHSLMVKTLEGDHLAQASDMLIRGVNGELYPCKPDIFAKTYEPWLT